MKELFSTEFQTHVSNSDKEEERVAEARALPLIP